eukprot:1158858-Pelagomonas_calceolata.AAC.8
MGTALLILKPCRKSITEVRGSSWTSGGDFATGPSLHRRGKHTEFFLFLSAQACACPLPGNTHSGFSVFIRFQTGFDLRLDWSSYAA